MVFHWIDGNDRLESITDMSYDVFVIIAMAPYLGFNRSI